MIVWWHVLLGVACGAIASLCYWLNLSWIVGVRLSFSGAQRDFGIEILPVFQTAPPYLQGALFAVGVFGGRLRYDVLYLGLPVQWLFIKTRSQK